MKRTPLKRKTWLRRVSRKRLTQAPVRARFVAETLEARELCEIRWDANCSGRASQVHEPLTRARAGRRFEAIVDPANAKAVCSWCHAQVHRNPAEAEARGFLTPSWETK